MNCHTFSMQIDIQEAKIWKPETRNAMTMTPPQKKTGYDSKDNNEKKIFLMKMKKALA